MTTFEAFAVSCACCFFLGAMLSWAARVRLVEWREGRNRRGGLLDEEFFREFRRPEPVTSIRTLVEAEDFEWTDA